jgi:hypothetical protein
MNTDNSSPSTSKAVCFQVDLSVICANNYKEYVAYKFFDDIAKVLENEENLAILDRDYVRDKYTSSLKAVITRYDNMSEVDKLSKAVEKSEIVIKTAEENVKKLIMKGDQIDVNSSGPGGDLQGFEGQRPAVQ